jgi:hypothetical protein
MRGALLAACLVAASLAALAQSLPDPRITPGAVDATVRQDNIQSTICAFGWSRAHRPPEAETYRIKRELMRTYGLTGIRLRDVELDHLVPLALAGAPEDVRNLWPELREPADGWTAAMKDELEAVLARDICAGVLPLAEAQRAIATDWRAAYRRYVRP